MMSHLFDPINENRLSSIIKYLLMLVSFAFGLLVVKMIGKPSICDSVFFCSLSKWQPWPAIWMKAIASYCCKGKLYMFFD